MFYFLVLFGLYANDDLIIEKEVIDELILRTDGCIPESLSELFEHVSYVCVRPAARAFFCYADPSENNVTDYHSLVTADDSYYTPT